MMLKGHFEAKKHAVRQTQDGWVVSFVVHPNDMTPQFATAPLGTRLMVGYAEIGDDEAPVAEQPKQPDPDRSERARETYHNLPLDKRLACDAGRLCADPRFQTFAEERKGLRFPPGSNKTARGSLTAEWMRSYLNVVSRAAIIVDPEARRKYEALEVEYKQWAGLMPEQRG